MVEEDPLGPLDLGFAAWFTRDTRRPPCQLYLVPPLDEASGDPGVQGTHALFEAVAAEPRLYATAVQTVGDKGWDGFLLALVG